jgi:hypothetical protein
VWIHDPVGGWANHSMGPGFFVGAPIAFAPAVGTFFTIDPLGDWSVRTGAAVHGQPAMRYLR